MASTVITPIASEIKSLIEGINKTPVVKAYVWQVGFAGLDALPAAVIGLPDIKRGPDAGQSPIGFALWNLSFPVNFYFDLDEAGKSQDAAAEYVEAFIAAVDASPALNGQADDDAVVSSVEVSYDLQDNARPLLAMECIVDLEHLEQK